MISVHPLRAWRQKRGLTLDAAAAGVGTFRGTWNDWESGRRIPDRNYMPKIYVFTAGAIQPNHFYNLPRLDGQEEFPFAADGAPELEAAA